MDTKYIKQIEDISCAVNGFDRNSEYSEVNGTNNTSDFTRTRAIHCNVADTYRLKFIRGNEVNMVLNAGILYPYSVVNVLTTSDTAIDTGDITLLY